MNTAASEPLSQKHEPCLDSCESNVNTCRKGINGFDNTMVELRGPCPRWIVDVLDAEALAAGSSRLDLVNQVLEPWALKRIHAATLITRITRRKGSSPETSGDALE